MYVFESLYGMIKCFCTEIHIFEFLCTRACLIQFEDWVLYRWRAGLGNQQAGHPQALPTPATIIVMLAILNATFALT